MVDVYKAHQINVSSLIQVMGFLLRRYEISPQILLFQPGLGVKNVPRQHFQPGLKISLMAQGKNGVIVT